jgi:hypothetical protein
MRELLRSIQSLRKKSGLEAHDVVKLTIATDEAGQGIINTFKDEIMNTAGLSDIHLSDTDGEELKVEDMIFTVKIEK